MTLNRRELIAASAGAMLSLKLSIPRPTPKVIAFDAFPIFDPRPAFAEAEKMSSSNGKELVALWRTKQFEYTWLRTVSQTYRPFDEVTADALEFACASLGVGLTPAQKTDLVDGYSNLKAWPDVPDILAQLKRSGHKLCLLSNMTEKILRWNVFSAGLDGMFDAFLSTDRVHQFKPAPAAYHTALDEFRVRKSQVVFVGFASWDAVGAKQFGYRAYWANRLAAAPEQLGAEADQTSVNLGDLISFVG